MRGFWIAVALIVGAALVASWAIMPVLPERMATHWGLDGEPNGWMDRLPAILILPALMVGLTLLLEFLPRLDPRRANILKFNQTYEQFILALMFLLALLHIGILSWGAGLEIPLTTMLSVSLAILFFVLARLLVTTHPNYTIGIRTPWALESNKNWYATNRLAAQLYIWSVPICLLGLLMPAWTPLFVLLAALGPAILACTYSYLYHAGAAVGAGRLRKPAKAKKRSRKKR